MQAAPLEREPRRGSSEALGHPWSVQHRGIRGVGGLGLEAGEADGQLGVELLVWKPLGREKQAPP